ADLGASINVMPYKKFKKLGIGELRPTKMSIHLADRTIRHPRGIIENILVRVDKWTLRSAVSCLLLDGSGLPVSANPPIQTFYSNSFAPFILTGPDFHYHDHTWSLSACVGISLASPCQSSVSHVVFIQTKRSRHPNMLNLSSPSLTPLTLEQSGHRSP